MAAARVTEKNTMKMRHLGFASSGFLALLLAGCSGSIGLYHRIQGGAIAQDRQPPPGSDLPYPNLASVPAAPAAQPPNEQMQIANRARGVVPEVSTPSPEALAGLELPGAPPPAPNVPGLNLPSIPSTPVIPRPPVVVAKTPPDGVPVALSFQRGSAVLPNEDVSILTNLVATRGVAKLRVGGFGDDVSLPLALARAKRLSDALTAAGVPPSAIILVANAAGSGGFVQLVY
jgi:hypothetical protein